MPVPPDLVAGSSPRAEPGPTAGRSAPRTPPPLARGTADRDGDARTEEAEAAFADEPGAGVLVLSEGRALLAERIDGAEPALALLPPAAAPHPLLRAYLGRVPQPDRPGAPIDAPAVGGPGAPIELRMLDRDAAAALEPDPTRWAGLRAAVGLPALHAGLLTEAVALANWHAAAGFCPRCGAPAESVQRGWARRCTDEGVLLFPRTDPAVIVLVTDDRDRVLLGSNAVWEADRYSLLAGFVEAGETLEHAVVREVAEESGVVVDDVEYLASQPWPYPGSLMFGFRARTGAAAAALARPDGEEILAVRWFTRAELADAAASAVLLPGRASIARWMLEEWFGGPLPDRPSVPGAAR